jgi:trehalose-phosphatase
VAFHTRGLDEARAEEIRGKVSEWWKRVGEEKGLALHRFDGGVELRVPGEDKGTAVKTVLDETGSDLSSAYLGDDITDEDAFKAMKGRGLAVLVRTRFRATAADIWLEPPEELLDFLGNWSALTGGER